MRRFPSLFPQSLMSDGMGRFAGSDVLSDLTGFGHNPGQLRARAHVPETLAPGAPLVVVLHGCTQTAEQYDAGSGWSTMAEECGFALLYPEQQRSNNPGLCFSWFLPQDNRRDRGEALSIRNMLLAMIEKHQLDPQRVFVTGLSAGGAMANVMLSTYPELFASGAIIAGLPYGTATDVPQAMERMRGQGLPRESELAALVRRASDHEGPWPTVSVWHGGADATVYPSNADAIVNQWRVVHGLGEEPSITDSVDGFPRRTWIDPQGRTCITSYSITGMAHGTPIATTGAEACGRAGPYILDKQISSTRHICRFWGLLDRPADALHKDRPSHLDAKTPGSAVAMRPAKRLEPLRQQEQLTAATGSPTGVAKVIDDALRAAGLMR